MSVKRFLKRAAQGAVATLAPHLWGGEGKLLVLMYHRVLPPAHPERGSEQPGMYVSPDTLRMHLGLLKRHFTPVHLEDWCARLERGEPLPRRACAITFDDGWRDNYLFAWPVLRELGVPASVFVVSSLVGTRYSFWPNRLARLLAAPRAASAAQVLAAALGDERIGSGAAMTPAQIDQIIVSCKRRSDAEMSEILDGLAPAECDEDCDLMSWDEIREISADGQIRIGSHTRRHVRFTPGLAQRTAEEEILGSRDEIEARLGVRPVSFCYPNGDHSRETTALVRSSYGCAVTTRRGWNDRHADRHLLARVGVHDEVALTPSAFLSRLAGVG